MYAGHLAESSDGGIPADRTPTETCFKFLNKYHECELGSAYIPSALFRECLNYKFLVLFPPSAHNLFRIRVNDRPNVVRNIFLLSSLVMKRHSGERSEVQGPFGISISGLLVTHI